MALNEQDLAEIDALMGASGHDAQVLGALRQKFPHLSWICCDASDVAEVPFREYTNYNIHFLDSSDHCARVTADPDRASGVILAKRSLA